jgi:hydroxymethylbilane synthase
MLPAVAQGAIGVSCRSDDVETRELLQALNDDITATAVACERAFLGELDGSCRTPIAGLAEIADGALRFRGLVLNPEGTAWHEIEQRGAPEDAVSIGASSGRELLALAGPNFLSSLTARS